VSQTATNQARATARESQLGLQKRRFKIQTTYPVFVPSPSWQKDRFKYKTVAKRRFRTRLQQIRDVVGAYKHTLCLQERRSVIPLCFLFVPSLSWQTFEF
jgi:hypothetical protein